MLCHQLENAEPLYTHAQMGPDEGIILIPYILFFIMATMACLNNRYIG